MLATTANVIGLDVVGTDAYWASNFNGVCSVGSVSLVTGVIGGDLPGGGCDLARGDGTRFGVLLLGMNRVSLYPVPGTTDFGPPFAVDFSPTTVLGVPTAIDLAGRVRPAGSGAVFAVGADPNNSRELVAAPGGDALYWIDASGIWTSGTTLFLVSPPTVALLASELEVRSIAVDATWVYFLSHARRGVFRVHR
jgi:hypothetical protein